MKTLYIDCGMGAAGDMLTAALLELLPAGQQEKILERLNSLGLDNVSVRANRVYKCGIGGTAVSVLIGGEEEGEDIHAHHHGEDGGHHHGPHHGEDEGHHHGSPHDHSHDGEGEHYHDHHASEDGHYHDDSEGGHHHEHHHDGEDGHHHEHHHGVEDGHHHEHHHGSDDGHHHEHHHGGEDGHHHGEEGAHSHSHQGMEGIRHIVTEHLNLDPETAENVMAVYGIVAEAESHVHGVPMTEIHFHELGTKDAIMDITAVCLLLKELSPDRIVASPVHVGSGQVRCAHGILPVPAPATAFILRDIPIYSGEIRGELCTPTGAALLRHFVDSFGPMPPMMVKAIGYGMGKKDFERANCVRVMLGESTDGNAPYRSGAASPDGNKQTAMPEGRTDRVLVLSCNLDDMTGEELGFAMERLFEGGARDVFYTPIYMKKDRPGILLSVICDPDKGEEMCGLIFRHTSTIGIRETEMRRHVLERREEEIETGDVLIRRKISEGYGVSRSKYEYDDLRKLALEKGLGLREAARLLDRGDWKG